MIEFFRSKRLQYDIVVNGVKTGKMLISNYKEKDLDTIFIIGMLSDN